MKSVNKENRLNQTTFLLNRCSHRSRGPQFYWLYSPDQWRTQKILMGGFWFSVIWWSFVFGVRCLWRHNLTSFPCFQTNVLAKFVDVMMHIFLHPLPLFLRHCTEYKPSAVQVRLSEENKLNATTQQFITAKISGYALKQGEWKTLIPTSEQFTTAKWGCAKISSNTSSWALKVCGWTGWRRPWFARSNFNKLHKNWECA